MDAENVLHETEYVVIIEKEGVGPVVPYPGGSDRPDGTRNHGYCDTKAQPELIPSIPEIQDWPKYRDLLEAINRYTPLRSVGCEIAVFPLEEEIGPSLNVHVGSYVDVAFEDLHLNKDKAHLFKLAKRISAHFDQFPDMWVRLELYLQMFAGLFWRDDCWGLTIKVHGHGRSEEEARTTWGYGAGVLAKCLVDWGEELKAGTETV